jgi:hypothetical protein
VIASAGEGLYPDEPLQRGIKAGGMLLEVTTRDNRVIQFRHIFRSSFDEWSRTAGDEGMAAAGVDSNEWLQDRSKR